MLDQISILTGESIATLMQRLIVILIQIRTSSPGYLPDIAQDCPNDTCQESLSMEWATELLITSCFNVSTITIDDIVTIKESFQITKRNSNVQFDPACATKLEDMILQKEMELLNQLIRDETVTVFDMCGLSAIVNGWNQWKDNTATNESRSSSIMSTQPGLTPNDIEMGIKEFYASLYSPPIPSFEMIINDPITRKMVRSNIAHAVISFYTELYNAIQTDASYNDTIRQLLQHTPNEVQALFTV
jgi:conserved oligomeric Golgi complex subunit 6